MNPALLTACIVLITLALWIGLGYFLYVLFQIRRAALAVEMLAYELQESVSQMKSASGKIFDFATTVRSGWMKTLELALGAATTFWERREERRSHADPGANEPVVQTPDFDQKRSC